MSPIKQILLSYLLTQPGICIVSEEEYVAIDFVNLLLPELKEDATLFFNSQQTVSIIEQARAVRGLVSAPERVLVFSDGVNPAYYNEVPVVIEVWKEEADGVLFGLGDFIYGVKFQKCRGFKPSALECIYLQ